MDWHKNEQATQASGLPTVESDDLARKAIANLTDLGDGTAIVSISVVVPSTEAKDVAARLMRDARPLALLR